MNTPFSLRVHAVRDEALGVKSFELQPFGQGELPAFTAGAHIEVHLEPTLTRCYSLLNSPEETLRYVIAVQRSQNEFGGSRFLHERVKEGDTLQISLPRNNFPLDEGVRRVCFIAGGIGITPLMSMMHRCNVLGIEWNLHYGVRTPANAAFLPELEKLAQATGNKVKTYFDRVPGGEGIALERLVREQSHDTHFYCCGPKGMLEAFEKATAPISERAHLEYFSAKSEAAKSGGFQVQLAKSGLTLDVPPGKSILDVVSDAGIDVQTSCREGICGSCETRIISGIADHRDSLLSDSERLENKSMMICCSGAKSPLLVLDL